MIREFESISQSDDRPALWANADTSFDIAHSPRAHPRQLREMLESEVGVMATASQELSERMLRHGRSSL
ncbi:hypothetical protein GCM10009758_07740 [Microbacterium hatanonis]